MDGGPAGREFGDECDESPTVGHAGEEDWNKRIVICGLKESRGRKSS